MKDRMDRFEDKVDEIRGSISNIDKTLAVNTESLVLHIKRTDLLEKKLQKFEVEMKPVSTHVERVNGIIKFILFIAATMGLLKLFGK